MRKYISLLLFIGLAWGQEDYLETIEEAMSRMALSMMGNVYIVDSVYASQKKVKIKNSIGEIMLKVRVVRKMPSKGGQVVLKKDKKYYQVKNYPGDRYTLKNVNGDFTFGYNVVIADDYEKWKEAASKREAEKKRVAEVAAEKKAEKTRVRVAAVMEAVWAEEKAKRAEKAAKKLAAKKAKRAEKAAKKLAAKEAAEELRKKNNPTLKEVMESWVGSHQSTLIKSWGPPDRTTSDGAGGNILIYNRGKGGNIITNNVRIPTTKLKGIIERPPYYEYDITTDNTYQRYRMFYVDDKGIIYHWKYED